MRQDQSFVLYSHETYHCLSCFLSKNSTWKVLFCTIMISFEKSVLTSQFPVNKVIVWSMLATYWQLIGGRNTKTRALISGAPFPFPFSPSPLLSPSLFPSPSLYPFPFPFPLPLSFSLAPFPFLRLPRRLNLTKVPKCVSCFTYDTQRHSLYKSS